MLTTRCARKITAAPWQGFRWHSASAPGTADPAAYCRDFVRKHDYDSWLLSPFYPKHLQNAYFALKAFSVCNSSFLVDIQLTFGSCLLVGRTSDGAGHRVQSHDRENENAVLAGHGHQCSRRACSDYSILSIDAMLTNRRVDHHGTPLP